MDVSEQKLSMKLEGFTNHIWGQNFPIYLLVKDNFVLIHHENLQALATKTYRISNMSPIIPNTVFAPRTTPYNLHKSASFEM